VLALGVAVSQAAKTERARAARAARTREADVEVSPTVESMVTEAVLRSQQPMFDPLGLTSDPGMYSFARDLELVNGRIAMLAAIGIPSAELFHEQLAGRVGLPMQLNAAGQAPHFLNGGNSNAIDAVVFISLAGMLAALGETAAHRSEGDSSFDPLNPHELRMQTLSPTFRCLLREAQRVNGRVAMVAVFCMFAVEAYTGEAVVDVTPFLFGA
jgi:hypothetical protein